MSRPVVLATVALALGIIAADRLFYENLDVPAWLSITMWGFSLLLAVLAWLCWHSEQRGQRESSRNGWNNRLFPWLAFLFFAVYGFARYTDYAEDVQKSWQAMERPPVNRGNPDEFDYVRWRWIQGVEDSTTLTARLRKRALAVRERLLTTYASAGMDEGTGYCGRSDTGRPLTVEP